VLACRWLHADVFRSLFLNFTAFSSIPFVTCSTARLALSEQTKGLSRVEICKNRSCGMRMKNALPVHAGQNSTVGLRAQGRVDEKGARRIPQFDQRRGRESKKNEKKLEKKQQKQASGHRAKEGRGKTENEKETEKKKRASLRRDRED